MTELVLDASVVVKWFVAGEERGSKAALALRREYEAGHTTVVVPSLLFLELINIAGRRWRWAPAELTELAEALDDLGFEVGEPELTGIAAWVGRGLTAYDATYVALAEERSSPLVTDDQHVLAVAPDVAQPLTQ